MRTRRKFSAKYEREAVAMLQSPGVSASQIAAELGIGASPTYARCWSFTMPLSGSKSRGAIHQLGQTISSCRMVQREHSDSRRTHSAPDS